MTVPAGPVALSTYVVQRKDVVDLEPDEPRVVWEDIATVEVPQRSKRKGVFEKALEIAGIPPVDGARLELRALDTASAFVQEVVGGAPPPPPPPPAREPEWVIA